MHFSTLISFSALAAFTVTVSAECCGTPGFCTGVGDCNIFCCNCDAKFHTDIETEQCRIFVCQDAWTGVPCDPKRSARAPQIDYTAADMGMLEEASGGMNGMSLEAFIEYSQNLGQTDTERLTGIFKEHDLNHDGVITIDEMRLYG